MRHTHSIAAAGSFSPESAQETVTLDFDDRFRRRKVFRTDSGAEFLLDLPEAQVLRIATAFLGALADPDNSRRVEAAGFNQAPMMPEDFAGFQRAEVARWQEMAQLTGIVMDP
jgi:urease accessory protein UreE